MGRLLTTAIGAGLIAVGAGAVVAPKFSATMFGLPTGDPVALAFVRAAGARDVILGALTFAVPDNPRALRRTVALGSLIALADAANLTAMRGPRPQLVFHIGGFIVFVLAAVAAHE